MIFVEFCKISVFIEKEKNERKDKAQIEKEAHQERLTRI
jgi:hypothetical protein